MVSVNNLDVEFSAKPLFRNISFFINPTDKIALVGRNGAGKSTLLKILAGLESPTSGSVGVSNGLVIGYLPQQMELADDVSLIDETKKVFNERFKLEETLKEINQKIKMLSESETEEMMKLLEETDFIQNKLLQNPVSQMEADTEKILLGLGFKRSDFTRPTSEFSGGWRMRVELAKILLLRPDLLLLDEPTNHLDIESIQWLEQFIQSSGKALIVVSHDRAFLDNITKRTIEISCGKIYDYKAKYSDFVRLRAERVEQQLRAYENQKKEIDDIKDFIERFRYKATKAVQVQSRIKQLEKIVPIEIDEIDKRAIRLKFPPAERSGDYPVITENLSKSFDEHKVFGGVEFTIKRGEKIAFVGKNGEGKTTMVRCLMNHIPYDGGIKIGNNVRIGYFAQNQAQLLDGEITVFDTIDRVATGDMRLRVNDLLGAFMFGGEEAEKKVKVLSGGEKTRLAMIKLLLEPYNFLILDEPTNHLDMKTKDILKEAIKDFNGTVIVVSHDREFLDGLVDKVFEFTNGQVKQHIGGIYDFLRKKNIESLNELNLSPRYVKKDEKSLNDSVSDEPSVSSSKQAYLESKERDRQLKRAKKRVESAEENINAIEKRLQHLENEISQGNASNEILTEYANAGEELEKAMEMWEKEQEIYEKLLEDIK